MKKSLKVNFIMNVVLTASSFIFPLITFPYSSHVLGPQGTGLVAFCLSIVTYFNMIAQLGVPTYGVRACAAVRDDKTALSRKVQEILIITLLCTFVSLILLFTIVLISGLPINEKTIILVTSVSILLNTLGVEWLYKALEEYSYITIRSIITKIVAVFALFLFVKTEGDCLQYAIVTIFASSASNVCNLVNLRKYIILKPLGKYEFKRHIRPILLLFVASCAVTVYTNLDTVILGVMASNTEVGYYDAALKVRRLLTAFVTSLGVVLLPRAAYYLEKNKYEEFIRMSNKAIQFVFFSSLPLAAACFLFAEPLILLLAGNAYEGAILPTRILSFVVILVGLSNITGTQMLIPLKNDKAMCVSAIAGAIVDLLANIVLIPHLMAVGTAIASVFAETTVLLFQIILLMRHIDIKRLYSLPIKPLISTFAASIFTFIFLLFIKNIIIQLSVGAIIFSVSYILSSLLIKDPLVLEVVSIFKSKLKKSE